MFTFALPLEKETSNAGMQLVRDRVVNGKWGNKKLLPFPFVNTGKQRKTFFVAMSYKILGGLGVKPPFKNKKSRLCRHLLFTILCVDFFRYGNKKCSDLINCTIIYVIR